MMEASDFKVSLKDSLSKYKTPNVFLLSSQLQRRVSMTGTRLMNEMNNMPLLSDHELPPHLREVAIVKGYRSPSSSLKECVQSAFVPTNETLNFWTHFLPTLYFGWRLTEFFETLNVQTNPYTWAYMAYMLTICIYPLISAFAHLFFSMSCLARDVWFFLDYGALSFYSFGAGLIYRAYAFPEGLISTAYGEIFLYVCAVNTVLCTFMACLSRFMESLFWIKVFRLGAFVIPWIWDSVPIWYRFFYPDSGMSEVDDQTMPYYLRQFLFSFFIGFFYASHLPERLAPGKFDIVGNSHQLLHVCGILATQQQMNGALRDLQYRRSSMEIGAVMDKGFWCVYVLFAVFTINCTVIGLFGLHSWRTLAKREKEKTN